MNEGEVERWLRWEDNFDDFDCLEEDEDGRGSKFCFLR